MNSLFLIAESDVPGKNLTKIPTGPVKEHTPQILNHLFFMKEILPYGCFQK